MIRPTVSKEAFADELAALIRRGEAIVSDADPEYWQLRYAEQEEELVATYDGWRDDVAHALRVALASEADIDAFVSEHYTPELFYEPHDGIHRQGRKQVAILERIERALKMVSVARPVKRRTLLRPDETWHRLREWTYGSAMAERLAAQILRADGYTSIDPSHPLGGPDGGCDALCRKDGKHWSVGVHFARGKEAFGALARKFAEDAEKTTGAADAFVFVTNQQLVKSQRAALKKKVAPLEADIYHLERVVGVLDAPGMRSVRRQFLFIDDDGDESLERVGRFVSSWDRVCRAVLSLAGPVEPGRRVRIQPVALLKSCGAAVDVCGRYEELEAVHQAILRGHSMPVDEDVIASVEELARAVDALAPSSGPTSE